MCRPRLPRKVAIAAVAALAVLAVPRAAPAPGPHAATDRGAHVQRGVGRWGPGVSPGASRVSPAANTVLTADITTAASGGLCSVPGIGDIGGLLGFCSLGSSGLIGDLNNICQPSLPDPEPAASGIDAMVAPPASGKQVATLYSQYGVAGDYWAATGLQCSDMTSLIGNNVAGMVFDAAKSIDRVTITVYQAAAGEGILGWLQNATDRLITGLGHAIYFPYLAVVVVLGAIWLAWQGLIRKRGTTTIEGTLWMVTACAAAIVLIGTPAAVTGLGRGVSDGMSQALNAAFAKLPSPGATSCLPLGKSDPQSQPATYNYTSGGTVVDQNADELWTVLVCKPWLDGEFGTSVYATGGAQPTAVNTYGRSLLWAQALAANEKPSQSLIKAKQAAYAGIASSIQTHDPSAYPLFQGKQWTTRLEVGLAALFAAVVAGILVLLISVTLILLKLGFLLLLIAGPFFLLVGTHPGFGRVVALRWLELLIGVLLKQAAIAIVLSVLLYSYTLIMGTSDSVLPWALKILMIALVTVAAFIYRKPFQHLFSAVGYGMLGSSDAAAADMARAGASARARTVGAATAVAPPFAAYRAFRWARRNPAQAAALAASLGTAGSTAVAAGAAVKAGPELAGDTAAAAGGTGAADGSAGTGAAAEAAARRVTIAARARAAPAEQDGGPGSGSASPPPLKLRERNGTESGPAAASGPAPWPGSGVPAPRTGTARPSGRLAAERPASAGPALRGAAPGLSDPGRLRAGTASSGSSGLSVSATSSGSSGPGAAGQPPRPAPPPRRPAKSWTASRGEAPASRGQAPAGRSVAPAGQQARGQALAASQGTPRPSTWLGHPMPGPLARPPDDPLAAGADADGRADRAPFWLRPRRRGAAPGGGPAGNPRD